MKDGAFYSTKHPHEPEIPPALDDEGRCLICGLFVQINVLSARLSALEEAVEEWAAKRRAYIDGEIHVGEFRDAEAALVYVALAGLGADTQEPKS